MRGKFCLAPTTCTFLLQNSENTSYTEHYFHPGFMARSMASSTHTK